MTDFEKPKLEKRIPDDLLPRYFAEMSDLDPQVTEEEIQEAADYVVENELDEDGSDYGSFPYPNGDMIYMDYFINQVKDQILANREALKAPIAEPRKKYEEESAEATEKMVSDKLLPRYFEAAKNLNPPVTEQEIQEAAGYVFDTGLDDEGRDYGWAYPDDMTEDDYFIKQVVDRIIEVRASK